MNKFHTLITLILIAMSPIKSYSQQLLNSSNQKGEYVIILHGIARSSKHMEKLAGYLEENGYEVINLDYPSTKHNLEELTQILTAEISSKITEDKKVHFVGYSMGGILTRIILGQNEYKSLGKVVQLAAPNKGSEVADFFQNWWVYKKFYGPAGQELITDQTQISKLLDKKINYDLGVIAGNFTIDPFSSFLIKGDDDGKVSVESAKVEGMKDFIVVSASHTFFPSNKNVQKQTLHFLRNGKFQ